MPAGNPMGYLFGSKKRGDIHLPATSREGKRKEEALKKKPGGLFARMMEGKKTFSDMAGNKKKMSLDERDTSTRKAKDFFQKMREKRAR